MKPLKTPTRTYRRAQTGENVYTQIGETKHWWELTEGDVCMYQGNAYQHRGVGYWRPVKCKDGEWVLAEGDVGMLDFSNQTAVTIVRIIKEPVFELVLDTGTEKAVG